MLSIIVCSIQLMTAMMLTMLQHIFYNQTLLFQSGLLTLCEKARAYYVSKHILD
jgi:hypothetical protein